MTPVLSTGVAEVVQQLASEAAMFANGYTIHDVLEGLGALFVLFAICSSRRYFRR